MSEVALTRLCPFCLEPLNECACLIEEAADISVTPDAIETAEHSAIEDQDAQPPYRGVITIEWPPPGPSPYSAMVGSLLCIYDAVSGEQIKTAVHTEVHAPVESAVTADLTLFVGEDGEPLFDGLPVMRDGEALTGTFPFVVSEMRVRQR